MLHGSRHVGARLIQRLSKLRNVTVVWGSQATAESIQLVAELKPGVVIIDVEMSDRTGIKVLQRVKGFAFSPAVIMTASLPNPHYRRECIKEGANYFFCLPDEIGDLYRVVNQLAESGK